MVNYGNSERCDVCTLDGAIKTLVGVSDLDPGQPQDNHMRLPRIERCLLFSDRRVHELFLNQVSVRA